MTDSQGQSSAVQAVVKLQHERLNLQKRLAETQLENQVLRTQLYHVSSVLDLAVSKLGQMGVALETPLDIRALRNRAIQAQAAAAAQGSLAGDDLTGGGDEDGGGAGGGKKFHTRVQLREHTKTVQCAAFRPGDDPLIATAGLDRRIVLQSFFSGEKSWEVLGHEESVSCLAWFEGTGRLLSGSLDNTVMLWDTTRTENAPVFEHTSAGFVLAAVTLDKGSVFACTDSSRRTAIVDTRTHKPVHWEHASRANTLAFDTSMGNLITGHSDGNICVWDIRKIGVAVATVDASAGANAPGSAAPSPRLDATASSLSGGNTPGPGNSISSAQQSALTPGQPPPPPVPCVSQFANDVSHASVSAITHYVCRDDTKRLICVSGDGIVRMYRGALSSSGTGRNGEYYHLRNVVTGIPTRGVSLASCFWRGKKDKSQEPMFYDDVEKDAEEQPAQRRLTQRDLLVTGGADNTATVLDVSEEGAGVVLELLEGHRDRVTSVVVHHSDTRPILATTSADSTVRIWVPVKA